jgi:hypothetical protein
MNSTTKPEDSMSDEFFGAFASVSLARPGHLCLPEPVYALSTKWS